MYNGTVQYMMNLRCCELPGNFFFQLLQVTSGTSRKTRTVEVILVTMHGALAKQ
jgi:hypothetical protein